MHRGSSQRADKRMFIASRKKKVAGKPKQIDTSASSGLCRDPMRAIVRGPEIYVKRNIVIHLCVYIYI